MIQIMATAMTENTERRGFAGYTVKRELRYLVLLALLSLCCACSTAPRESNVDPLEPANRAVFAFNERLDKVALKPLARGYAAVTPAPVQKGVGNFFANLSDLTGALNAVLQLRFAEAGRNGGRFIVNSTIGALGLVDVASDLGITPYRTDFGVTLATWGVSSGPYLMVPFFGPRTVRSGLGSMVDAASSVQWHFDTDTRNSLLGVEVIDDRAALLNIEGLITGDRYIFIRDAYIQHRRHQIDGKVVDDFFLASEGDGDWEEEWN